MLATMRPAQHHPISNQVGHSRSASRNSNYSASNNTVSAGAVGPSASPSRASSAKVSRSNSIRSNSDSGERNTGLQGSTANSKNARSSKKAQAPSSLSKEVETVKKQQTTPGLISLSRPLHDEDNESGRGSGKDEAGGVATEKSTKPRRRKDKTAGHLMPAPDAAVLSSSAPAIHTNGEGQWSMPAGHRKEEEEPLTWQQQMLGASSTTTPEKKKAGKKGANKKGSVTPNAAPSPSTAKDSLTWQQELLGSNKARGPTFDVFADAKDEATFGSGNEQRQQGDGQGKGRKKQGASANVKSAGGGRKRADSAGEMRLGMTAAGKGGGNGYGPPSAPLSNIHHGGSFANAMEFQGPSTPNSKLAYAGPNFHNSPSAASLPVPKFLQHRGVIAGGGEMPKSPSSPFAREAILRNAVKGTGSGVSNDGDVSTSSEEGTEEEDALRRSGRGATAPPELQRHDRNDGTEDKRSMTIEGLLAKMMRPGSD